MALAEQKHHPEYRELAVISIADVISTGLITNGELIQGYLGLLTCWGTIPLISTKQSSAPAENMAAGNNTAATRR